MKTKSALPWFGSDSEVAPQLAALLDDCKHVTIPFCGGLAILPHLKARAILANDKHKDALNFYRYAAGVYGVDAQQALFARCQNTLSHPDEMALATQSLNGETVEAAWAFWAICWLGYKGKGGTKGQGGLPSVRRTATGGSNASRVRASANDLEAWAIEFQRCEWDKADFREILASAADDPSCGLYVDAPWDGPGKAYLHAFVAQDHRDLATLLGRFKKTKVVVRYGDTPLIRELYAGPEWTITEAASRNQANNVKGGLWITRNLAL